MKLAERLLSDNSAGLVVDADGRRWFRPRQVIFETIAITADELHQGGWLGFEHELPPPQWGKEPSHQEIRDFARLASRRFIEFWYRVFDVTVARALCGRGREVFEKPFFSPSSLVDIGIPEEQSQSSVHPRLHRKIIGEYENSRRAAVRFRIFYLSNYLEDLTADTIAALRPCRRLWDLKRSRRNLLSELTATRLLLNSPLVTPPPGGSISVADFIRHSLDVELLEALDSLAAERAERKIAAENIRSLIHRRRDGRLESLKEHERLDLIRHGELLRLHPVWHTMFGVLNLVSSLHERARFAALLETNAFRRRLNISRVRYLHRRYGMEGDSTGNMRRAVADYEQRFEKALLALSPVGGEPGRETAAERLYGIVHQLRVYLGSSENPSGVEDAVFFSGLLAGPPPAKRSEPDSVGGEQGSVGSENESVDRTLFSRFPEILIELRRIDNEIIAIYDEAADRPVEKKQTGREPRTAPESPLPEQKEATDAADSPPDTKYPGLERLRLPEDVVIGDPFQEPIILNAARDLILKRLRPVRRTSQTYSLIPEHRHGALTLNPIMRLWKDRPNAIDGDSPAITRLELNTRETVECLIRLAGLVDERLPEREVVRGAIVGLRRGRETLATMNFFLLPGSCYPLREIHRLDFPEFRGRVIGETRSPGELGVAPGEEAVLTGGWYKKKNHSLYYPVGGDNARLLSLIWRSGRAPGPPAFFFALGQFVHDTLPDNFIYYRSAGKTFRDCVDEYYRMEDRIRKNRGERFGRRKPDNTREGVRFMFAVAYSRLIMEALTGSSQSHFRHPPTEQWLNRRLELPVPSITDRDYFRRIRLQARELILEAGDSIREEDYEHVQSSGS